MESKTQHGYLVLADISGYTSFLAGTELDHAHEILTDLLEIIVGHFKSVLTICKLEGDAVFAYAPETRIPRGETLLELIEATYVAFRSRAESVHRQTTCECNACRAIPTLDLKFLTHHGDFVVQRVSGTSELVGSDVNLIHRLLKNHVSEATGWKAYALFTARGLDHLGVRPAALHEQVEAYEHLGEVTTLSFNLHARFQELIAARRLFITAQEADGVLTQEYAAPPPVVWEWLNDPVRRGEWMAGTTWTAAARPGGRTGAGARNHCAHGQGETSFETVLDWRPFDYFTVEQTDEAGLKLTVTFKLEPLPEDRTRLHVHMLIKLKPLPHWLIRMFPARVLRLLHYPQDLAHLANLIAARPEALDRADVPAPAAV